MKTILAILLLTTLAACDGQTAVEACAAAKNGLSADECFYQLNH